METIAWHWRLRIDLLSLRLRKRRLVFEDKYSSLPLCKLEMQILQFCNNYFNKINYRFNIYNTFLNTHKNLNFWCINGEFAVRGGFMCKNGAVFCFRKMCGQETNIKTGKLYQVLGCNDVYAKCSCTKYYLRIKVFWNKPVSFSHNIEKSLDNFGLKERFDRLISNLVIRFPFNG